MVAAFSNVQKAYGKPFIFTEVGYRSGDGTNRAPWDWGLSMVADPAEQADCYAALFEVWSREASWMKGPFWWAWDVSPPAAGDTGYTYMCEYLANADGLMATMAAESPLLGRPLDDVLNWNRPRFPSGCYCTEAGREHKWGLALEVVHYALVRAGQRARS